LSPRVFIKEKIQIINLTGTTNKKKVTTPRANDQAVPTAALPEQKTGQDHHQCKGQDRHQCKG